ncbi:TPA: Gfo/Idh/MocA family oxidoreductase [Candidatus Poribacteria bacterium]|nr:Gfo/Idh/MocA family oxidoreductase [Candidatus Poribacteria bacterium]HIC03719.1 Gfo/Idh/MocA family oxidoreductase [Candidatus Poribacteria bacterium]HIC19312.1 Gfo/Idh/MocA family oxidoreductase [Candidatus Poribacteria bacterium]HIO49711.1 Gfo/Idh/MocA family oxidoreductase [Candidatus Poribacteria bacterium]HIO78622.1 Gfo/Idh/MocA family oxidoreductase [Candidatus Poribacteria bacterium]
MFKCAILGCRGRARSHAKAYQDITVGKLASICDMNKERLHEFGDMFDIDQRYTDIHEMLEKEKPDLLHIVTAPVLRGTMQFIRYPLMNIASEHRVPAVIIEKPIAVMGEDWRQIRDLADRTETKFAVNTQLHFHPKNLELKRDVTEGKIGEIKLIEASSRNPPVDQAPHTLQLVSSYIDNSQPVKVMGQVSGSNQLNSDQPSPDNATARIEYANGIQASVAFGPEMAIRVLSETSNNRHKRVCVFGTKGFVHWRFESWEKFTNEYGYQSGDLSYGEENAVAQIGLTEAMFDWLEDRNKVHPTNLKQSLAEFNLLLGIYQSGLIRQPIDLPFDPPDNFIQHMKDIL